jgi:hypothetical protein
LAVSVVEVREIIEESIDLLNKRSDEADSQGSVATLESVRRVLIRNEKKIWLRAKKGRVMLADVSEAAVRLRRVLASSSELDTVDTAVGEVKALAMAIEEESRKRSMVVT